MKIKKVVANNFLGLNFAHELEGVNVIYGPNHSGKTAIAKALRLGLTGKLPEPIGVRGIYQLAGNTHEAGGMTLCLETDTGREIELGWAKSEKGSVTKTGNIPDDLKLDDLLCDVRQFFGLTAEKRINTIFAACDVASLGFTADTLTRRIQEIDAMPRATAELQRGLIESKIHNLFTATDAQEACSTLIAWLKEEVSFAKKKDTDLSGQMSGLRLKMGQDRPTDQSKAIQDIESKMGKAEMDSGLNYGRKLSAAEQAQKRLGLLGVSGMLSEAVEGKLDALRAILEGADKTRNELKAADPAPTTELQAKVQAMEDNIRQLASSIVPLEAELDAENKLFKTVERLELCADCVARLSEGRKAKADKLNSKIETTKKSMAKIQKEMAKDLENLNALKLAADVHADKVSKNEQAAMEADKAKQAIEAAYKEYVAAKKELDAMPKAPDNTALNAELLALRAKQSAFETFKHNQKRMDEIESDLMQVRCKVEVFGKAYKLVLEEQSRVMDAAFNQVLTVARHFTDGLLNSPIEFYKGELGRRVSELDKQQGNTAPVGAWISHETFSGSEMLLSYAGFSVALCKDAPFKLVVMDELNACHSTKRDALLRRMVELEAKGIIDQFVGIVPEIGEKVEGVNYIQL